MLRSQMVLPVCLGITIASGALISLAIADRDRPLMARRQVLSAGVQLVAMYTLQVFSSRTILTLILIEVPHHQALHRVVRHSRVFDDHSELLHILCVNHMLLLVSTKSTSTRLMQSRTFSWTVRGCRLLI